MGKEQTPFRLNPAFLERPGGLNDIFAYFLQRFNLGVGAARKRSLQPRVVISVSGKGPPFTWDDLCKFGGCLGSFELL